MYLLVAAQQRSTLITAERDGAAGTVAHDLGRHSRQDQDFFIIKDMPSFVHSGIESTVLLRTTHPLTADGRRAYQRSRGPQHPLCGVTRAERWIRDIEAPLEHRRSRTLLSFQMTLLMKLGDRFTLDCPHRQKMFINRPC